MGINSEQLDQQVALLGLLSDASKSKNTLLAGPAFTTPESQERISKINAVLDYITSNSGRDISLSEVASTAFLTPTAFCRYFKQHTGKTFVQFTNEVRISKACRMLLSTDENVSQVCFESGFSNLSNFNRIFKKQMGVSPKDYRKLTQTK